MNVIEAAINDRIDEVTQSNFELLIETGLQQKYCDVFDKIMEMVPESATALMMELDSIMVNIEAFVEEKSYKAGLIDGMQIGGVTA
jgi:hypothetical protein